MSAAAIDWATGRGRSWVRPSARLAPRAIGAVVLLALALLGVPSAAGAHLRSGTVAVDFRASLRHPDTAAYQARIFQSDRGLQVTATRGHTVELLGYVGEPTFRLSPAGLSVNTASPTAAATGLIARDQRVPTSTPRWRLSRGRTSVVWHDVRSDRLPPGVTRGAFSVPLLVDGRRTSLQGELVRFSRPPLWLWLAILAGLLALGTAPMLRRDWDLVRPAAIACAACACVATVVLAMAFALDTYASPGTWIEGLDEIAFLAVGLGVMLRGPRLWRPGAAIAVGLVSIAAALLDGAVFLHPIVLAILPGPIIRAAVMTAFAAGVDATILGCRVYLDADEIPGGLSATLGFAPAAASPSPRSTSHRPG